MNDLMAFDLAPGRLYQMVAPRAVGRPALNALLARLALATPAGLLLAVDAGGSAFDPLWIAREIRRRRADYLPCLERVQVARAFTCHELASVLERETAGARAVVVFDFLALLDDENVTIPERRAVFARLLRRLRVLCGAAPVLLWTRPPVLAHVQLLAESLAAQCDQVLIYAPPEPPPLARLFP